MITTPRAFSLQSLILTLLGGSGCGSESPAGDAGTARDAIITQDGGHTPTDAAIRGERSPVDAAIHGERHPADATIARDTVLSSCAAGGNLHASQKCVGREVHWFDACGRQRERVEDCGDRGMSCLGVEWLYQSTCSNGGWCTAADLSGSSSWAEWRHFPCDNTLKDTKYDGSRRVVLCRPYP